MALLRFVHIISFALIIGNITGQNLVLNPSFEEYRKLPFIYNNELDSFFCKYWSVPNESSPDYYRKNSKEKKLGIPTNMFGFHPARSGDGYIGIAPLTWDGYMEHLTGTLSRSLSYGKTYNIKFYIRFAGNYCYFFASDIGVYFSEDMFPLNVGMPFYEKILDTKIRADVKHKGFIKDTCWQLIQGRYVAKGGEKYITLGIFYEESWNFEEKKLNFLHVKQNEKKKVNFYKNNQDILLINPNYIPNNEFDGDIAYYFIDDVSVELDTTVDTSIPPANRRL